jgi:outer membrane receptor protein involved in Fe transport
VGLDRVAAFVSAVVLLHGFAAAADAADAVGTDLPTVTVQATAIAGNAIDIDKIPAHVETLYSADLSRIGPSSLAGSLDSRLGSVNVNDNLDDPFQPDILYRGFEASPVLGTPQGLAVYQNGVRINEAFGDTVNWDLFPDVAINQVDIVSSNPVYGLNALGGAISVTMKNGFTYQGAEVEGSGGSFG